MSQPPSPTRRPYALASKDISRMKECYVDTKNGNSKRKKSKPNRTGWYGEVPKRRQSKRLEELASLRTPSQENQEVRLKSHGSRKKPVRKRLRVASSSDESSRDGVSIDSGNFCSASSFSSSSLSSTSSVSSFSSSSTLDEDSNSSLSSSSSSSSGASYSSSLVTTSSRSSSDNSTSSDDSTGDMDHAFQEFLNSKAQGTLLELVTTGEGFILGREPLATSNIGHFLDTFDVPSDFEKEMLGANPSD